jgi:hypothetical protein
MRNLHDAGSAHPDDADLVRMMDGEEATDRKHALAGHVAACGRCAGAAAALQRDAATVRAWLELAAFEDADFEDADSDRVAPARQPAAGLPARSREGSRRRPFAVAPWLLRAAAIVLLAAAPVAAIPSLRSALLDAVAGGRADGPAVPPVTGPGAEAAGPPDVAGVRFVPAAGSFTVRIDAAQALGSLHILPAGGQEALLRVGHPGIGAVVAPSGVEIRNTAGDAGSYTLHLPAGVTSVTVVVAGGRVAVLSRDRIAAGAEVPLR